MMPLTCSSFSAVSRAPAEALFEDSVTTFIVRLGRPTAMGAEGGGEGVGEGREGVGLGGPCGAVHRLLGGGGGAGQQDRRVGAGGGEGADAGPRLQPGLLAELLAADQDGGRAVDDARRIA